jgi:hypothetical protein
MTVDEFVNSVLHCLGQINPLYAALGLAVWILFGAKIKGLLGSIKLPSLPSLPNQPARPVDPKTDLNAWLEAHPLLDRLWVRLKDQFAQVPDGKIDEDTLYLKLLEAIKNVK